MSPDLAIAILVFLASAVSVWFLGVGLAKYGDALASLTGLGRMFVGSILVALATSLPELSTIISAVRLDPPNPQLAVGNVLGANMLDVFIFAMVALFFGGRRFLQQTSPRQGYLMVLAAAMTGGAVLLGAVKLDFNLWRVGLSSVILLVIYGVGMWVVFQNRASGDDEGADSAGGLSLSRAWMMFGLVSVGVIIAGIALAWSTDRVADITGVSSSTLGILAVSLVTTLPELSSTVAAARMGAIDLGVAGLFGSAVFNASILVYADPFYRGGVLVNQAEPAHIIAGCVAFGLILAALALVMGRNRIPAPIAVGGLVVMAGAWVAAAVVVGTMGAA
jgi:cation:H+ antiporter